MVCCKFYIYEITLLCHEIITDLNKNPRVADNYFRKLASHNSYTLVFNLNIVNMLTSRGYFRN